MTLLQALKFTSLSLISAALVACGGGGGGGSGSSQVPAPVISSQPASTSVYDTQDASFSVSATDTNTISYQWKKNGVDVVGETNGTYLLKSAALTDNGASITVAVSGKGGVTLSSAATLTVISRAPKIAIDPTPQSVIAGKNATFTATTTGLAPFTYQWLKNGQTITGATSSSFTTPVTLGDNAKQYSVRVSNSFGSVTSAGAVLTVQPSTITNLVISEVSTCYYYNYACWFEIYNPTSNSINLSSYSIRSRSVDVTNGQVTASQTFSLPNISIPSDGYTIISGNPENLKQRGIQNIRLRTINNVPKWVESGFIEILNNGATVDFVAFGNTTQTPTTSGKWTGANVAALPYSQDDYGRSIVRPYPLTASTNTYSSADWVFVDWVTPAGRNDVPAGTLDADNDGIPDSAEVAGGTFAGIDLYAMGARTGKRDIFIELDRMESTAAGINPKIDSLQMIVSAFAKKGINVVFDAGNSFSDTFSIANFNLGQGSNIVPYEKCVNFDATVCIQNVSDKRSIYDWKEENMDLRRRSIFHYVLMSNSEAVDGSVGDASGTGEINGNDIIIALGNYIAVPTTTAQFNQLINTHALAIMHELGHNLGLRHGGNENLNYKPNHYSIMNYIYVNGLDPDPSSMTAYQRWRKAKGDGTPTSGCSLVASPCGDKSQFIIDYSNGTSAPLDENALMESANIGRGSNANAYADWDQNGILTTTAISKDLNGDGYKTILTDYDEWSNIVLPFSRKYYGNSLPNPLKTPSVPLEPIGNDKQEVISDKFNFKVQ